MTAYVVYYRMLGSSAWHLSTVYATRDGAERRAGELILSGLEVCIRERAA